jgi:hypothetical protein
MNKKAEIEYVKCALAGVGEVPLQPPREEEPPDCMVELARGTVGIEVTRLRSEEETASYNTRHVVASQEHVVDLARRVYMRAGFPPVSVSFTFYRDAAIPKAQTKTVASDLARRVARIATSTGRRAPANTYRDHHLDNAFAPSAGIIWASAGDRMSWRPRIGGPVRPATLADLQGTLEPKEQLLTRYRQVAPTVWLLVICDVMAPGLFVDPPTPPIDFELETGFDRVLCCSWNGGVTVDIPLIRPERVA